MASNSRSIWLTAAAPLVVVSGASALAGSAYGQSLLIPDATLGNEPSQVVNTSDVNGLPSELVTGGAQRGQNVFHSFSEFNIGDSERVYFDNPIDVQNILSRVTGNNPSNIFGTLGVDGPASLFLLNPNGIVFGSEARLDLQGSFLATTAGSLVFPNGDTFSALDPQPPTLLTVSVPLGLQYEPQSSGAIVAEGSELSVESGRSLVLAGGVINLQNSVLTVGLPEMGQIELGAATGSGTVELAVNGDLLSLTFPDTIDRADISLSGTTLRVASNDGGSIAINAQNLDLLGSSLLEAGIAPGLGTEGSQAGDITLDAKGTIDIGQSSFVSNNVFRDALGSSGNIFITTERLLATSGSKLDAQVTGQGDAGNIFINASDSVLFDGALIMDNGQVAFSGAFSNVNPDVIGNGGNIEINTASLEVLNGAQLAVGIRGQGNAGHVLINASKRVVFDGLILMGDERIGFPSGVFSSVDVGARGDAGNIEINTASLEVSGAAQLLSGTRGQGNAGHVLINASDRVVINGAIVTNGRGFASSILSLVDRGAEGDGGNIEINTAFLTVSGGAQLAAGVRGQGDSGNVTINASDRVVFDGIIATDNFQGFGGGAFSSVERGGIGDGGEITINTNSLEIHNGAQLVAVTRGQSNAAGDITINASMLDVRNGAQLVTSTLGRGNAGNIIINASDLIMFDGTLAIDDGEPIPSGVFSSVQERAIGEGGDIRINTGALFLTDAVLSASTSGEGNAGDVVISATREFQAFNSNIRTTAEQFSGGKISITASEIYLFGDSNVRTNVTSGAGGGGDITLIANSILAFGDSDILAFAQDGQGGNITLNTRAFFGENYQPSPPGIDPFSLDDNNRVDINASGAVSGVITIPDVSFIENSLTALPDVVIDTEQLIAGSCIARTDTGGSFIMSGRGGLPDRPSDTFTAPYSTGFVLPLPADGAAAVEDDSTASWQPGDSIVEPEGLFQLPDGRVVISQRCKSE